MPFTIAAIYRCKPGTEAVVEGHLSSMIEPTRDEPGCEDYRAHRSKDDPQQFLLYERYADEAGFEAHKDSAHFEEHIRNGAWLHLESREVIFCQEIAG